jgi:hypothetical protein
MCARMTRNDAIWRGRLTRAERNPILSVTSSGHYADVVNSISVDMKACEYLALTTDGWTDLRSRFLESDSAWLRPFQAWLSSCRGGTSAFRPRAWVVIIFISLKAVKAQLSSWGYWARELDKNRAQALSLSSQCFLIRLSGK